MSRKVLSTLGLSLIVVGLLALPAMGQQGRRGGGFGRTQTLFSLAGNEAVQKEIGVTDAAKVEALADEYREALQAEMQTAGISFQGLRDLPEAERDAKMREIQTKSAEVAKKVGDKLEPKLKEALTAEQFKRLTEIKIQADGIAALTEAAVVKELGLSAEQQKKIADIRAEGEKAARELFASAGTGDGAREALTKFREANAKTLAQATDVLDAGQKEKFTALKGKPFDTAQLQGRGGRGRRGNNQN